MKISDVMSRKVVSVSPEESFSGAVRKLSSKNITGMPVVSGGKVVGVVTQSDIIRSLDVFSRINDASDAAAVRKLLKDADVSKDAVRKVRNRKVKDIMSRKIVTVDGGKSIYEAAKLINRNSIDRLPVVSGGRLVGIITKKDLIRAIMKISS
ncbi:MAG: CBS domain-containing protein [Candidatus Aenigmarchaeota archaeon]|nr:CBS domain-containing protein [Candidatus Aenigmarchaeota archaeon]